MLQPIGYCVVISNLKFIAFCCYHSVVMMHVPTSLIPDFRQLTGNVQSTFLTCTTFLLHAAIHVLNWLIIFPFSSFQFIDSIQAVT